MGVPFFIALEPYLLLVSDAFTPQRMLCHACSCCCVSEKGCVHSQGVMVLAAQVARRQRRGYDGSERGRMELGMQRFVTQVIDMYRSGFDSRRMLLQARFNLPPCSLLGFLLASPCICWQTLV